MSTDLVSIDKAVTMTTYDDIRRMKAVTLVTKLFPEYEKLRNAPPGSRERSLFITQWKYLYHLISLSGYQVPHVQQKYVIIQRPMFAKIAAYLLMGVPGYPKNARNFVGPDDRAMKYSNVIVMNSKWKGTELFAFTNRL